MRIEDLQPSPITATDLAEVVAAVRSHLLLPDAGPLLFTLGSYAGNRLPGPPVWALLVGPPSGGKTEILTPLLGLPDVRLASVVTEGALLSGVAKREHAPGAKGGLLREIGDFGYVLMKDFTSILAMNRDARGAVLAALREIYDGAWTRHVGTDGGKTLSWAGKIGLIGGTTPAIDGHHAVMASLGERFLFYRLPPADEIELVDASLDQVDDDDADARRTALRGVFRGLLERLPAKPTVERLTLEERTYLSGWARLAVRGRSAVERDSGTTREITLVPEPEAPARLAQALYRLWAGILLIGADRGRAWEVIRHVALSCLPALRRRVLEVLHSPRGWARTAVIAGAVGHPTNTTLRACEDLFVHGVLERRAEGGGDGGQGRAYEWRLAPWAAEILGSTPPTFNQMYAPARSAIAKEVLAVPQAARPSVLTPTFGEKFGSGPPARCYCEWHRGEVLTADGARACAECGTPFTVTAVAP